MVVVNIKGKKCAWFFVTAHFFDLFNHKCASLVSFTYKSPCYPNSHTYCSNNNSTQVKAITSRRFWFWPWWRQSFWDNVQAVPAQEYTAVHFLGSENLHCLGFQTPRSGLLRILGQEWLGHHLKVVVVKIKVKAPWRRTLFLVGSWSFSSHDVPQEDKQTTAAADRQATSNVPLKAKNNFRN